MSSLIRSGRHCKYDLKVHLVFITKYRKDVLTQKMLEALNSIFTSVCDDYQAELIEINGEEDHVHLLISYPPKTSLSKFINTLKGVSSRLLRIQFPEIKKYLWKGHLWTRSYYAGSCGGATIATIKAYIENQRLPEN